MAVTSGCKNGCKIGRSGEVQGKVCCPRNQTCAVHPGLANIWYDYVINLCNHDSCLCQR